jgi:phage head maturation protease
MPHVLSRAGSSVAQVTKQCRGTLCSKGSDGLPANTFRFVITNDSVDREGDVLVPSGGVLDEFMKNPVILWVHGFYSLPIGKAIAIGLSPGKREVYADITFAVEEYEFAKQVYYLYKGRFLNAVSVGFKILEAGPASDHLTTREDLAKNRKAQRVIRRWLLLEISCVPIPANPGALRKAIASGQISVTAPRLRENLFPPNPVELAIDQLKKTLGWTDTRLDSLTVAEIRALEAAIAKSNPPKKVKPRETQARPVAGRTTPVAAVKTLNEIADEIAARIARRF